MEDFSLIILCKGQEHLLGATLDTLKCQQGAFEVVVFADDRQKDLASHYPELKLVVEKPSERVSEMMNRALKVARGAYLQFLEPGDRYISQQGIQFLASLIEKRPPLIFDGKGDGRFCWVDREKALAAGGFDERLHSCSFKDFFYRLSNQGIVPVISSRVLVDSSKEPAESMPEMLRVLYRHFGVAGAIRWLFVENRTSALEKMSRFIKQSFWPDEK
jgi:hypothetical protein